VSHTNGKIHEIIKKMNHILKVSVLLT